jgi:dethiobiotin synthetase
MLTGLFVTGTDTGVGKTVISAALLRHFRLSGATPGAMKPVETGVQPGAEALSDGARLLAEVAPLQTLQEVNPYRFRQPLAPFDAARLEGTRVDLEDIVRKYRRLTERFRPIVVEGAGGLLVPVGDDWSVRDLIVALNLPVVVVGRTGLGGINQALLTLEALRQAEGRIIALVLNQTVPPRDAVEEVQQRSTVELLGPRAGVPVIGPLHYLAGLSENWSETIEMLAHSEGIRQLADRVAEKP